MAAKYGDIERVIDCLSNFCCTCYSEPLFVYETFVIGLGNQVNFVYQDADGQTALHAACFGGHLAVVHIIFQSGAALDKMDLSQNTPLSLALIQGHNDVVKYLIKAGSSTSLKVYSFIFLKIYKQINNLVICLNESRGKGE